MAMRGKMSHSKAVVSHPLSQDDEPASSPVLARWLYLFSLSLTHHRMEWGGKEGQL